MYIFRLKIHILRLRTCIINLRIKKLCGQIGFVARVNGTFHTAKPKFLPAQAGVPMRENKRKGVWKGTPVPSKPLSECHSKAVQTPCKGTTSRVDVHHTRALDVFVAMPHMAVDVDVALAPYGAFRPANVGILQINVAFARCFSHKMAG